MFDGSDIAQVQFGGGEWVMPTDTPYDRQLLREHVEMFIGPSGTLRLALHGTQWTVSRRSDAQPSCTTCSQPLGCLRCFREEDPAPICLECVLQPTSNDEILGG